MKIVVVGGGSGGHVTPVIAVVKEILKKRPKADVEFWTDKKYFETSKESVRASGLEMRVRKLSSGKLRRYTNFGFQAEQRPANNPHSRTYLPLEVVPLQMRQPT